MPKDTRIVTLTISVLLAMALEFGHSPPSHAQDSLYIGDNGDSTVKRFRSTDGQYQGTFVKQSVGGLRGPMGLVFAGLGELIVSDQNVNTSTNGDILEYDQNGLVNRIVTNGDPNAPGVPRGIIVGIDNSTLFVAEFSTESRQYKPVLPGRLLKYKNDGTFIGAYAPPAATPLGTCSLPTPNSPGEFHPRGVVVGPDARLYVSNYPCTATRVGGQVLRFTLDGQFVDVFVDSVNDLQRPEGLVFGPDGNLYITSFKSGATGNDKILIFQGPRGGTPGAFVDQINLDPPGVSDTARSYAQALLFGPDGKLFVPITGNGPDTGSVRRYDVSTKAYDVFVAPMASGGPLQTPYYLTFGGTNRSTLTYPTPNPPGL